MKASKSIGVLLSGFSRTRRKEHKTIEKREVMRIVVCNHWKESFVQARVLMVCVERLFVRSLGMSPFRGLTSVR